MPRPPSQRSPRTRRWGKAKHLVGLGATIDGDAGLVHGTLELEELQAYRCESLAGRHNSQAVDGGSERLQQAFDGLSRAPAGIQ